MPMDPITTVQEIDPRGKFIHLFGVEQLAIKSKGTTKRLGTLVLL